MNRYYTTDLSYLLKGEINIFKDYFNDHPNYDYVVYDLEIGSSAAYKEASTIKEFLKLGGYDSEDDIFEESGGSCFITQDLFNLIRLTACQYDVMIEENILVCFMIASREDILNYGKTIRK